MDDDEEGVFFLALLSPIVSPFPVLFLSAELGFSLVVFLEEMFLLLEPCGGVPFLTARDMLLLLVLVVAGEEEDNEDEEARAPA